MPRMSEQFSLIFFVYSKRHVNFFLEGHFLKALEFGKLLYVCIVYNWFHDQFHVRSTCSDENETVG